MAPEPSLKQNASASLFFTIFIPNTMEESFFYVWHFTVVHWFQLFPVHLLQLTFGNHIDIFHVRFENIFLTNQEYYQF
jgi:hypothetical protein